DYYCQSYVSGLNAHYIF
nr:immunoglobulin light chain junction region [Macaca mulatta]